MTKQLSNKEYLEARNSLFTVVAFIRGYRVETYGNLNIKKAVEYVIRQQKDGAVCLIFSEGKLPEGEHSRKFQDYVKYAMGA